MAPRVEEFAIRTDNTNLPPVTLVLGGARSGKSRFAENLLMADASWDGLVYVATATAGDGEMRQRIDAHQSRRGTNWRTVEAPVEIAAALTDNVSPQTPALVDCLTLWVSNLMMAHRDIRSETEQLLNAVSGLTGPVVFVANEVGLGIVPDNALARQFRDEAGWLNQQIAGVAYRVDFIAAGLPLNLKNTSNLKG